MMAGQGAQGGGANPMMQMMSGMMMGGAMMGAGHEDDSVSRAWWARDVSCHCILATISNGSSVNLPCTATQDLFSNYWKEVWQWDAKATARWVGIIEGLEEYAELFLMNQINGLKLLAMDGMVMMQIGVTQMGARAKLLDEINHLSEFPAVAQPTCNCCTDHETIGFVCVQESTAYRSTCTATALARTCTPDTFSLVYGKVSLVRLLFRWLRVWLASFTCQQKAFMSMARMDFT